MKKIVYILLPLLLLCSCTAMDENPYEGALFDLVVEAEYPQEYEEFARAGVSVKVVNSMLGHSYSALTDDSHKAHFSLPAGMYRISFSDRNGEHIFNATTDRYLLRENGQVLPLSLKHSKAGTIVVKEIYSGGCRKDPMEGTYIGDQYVILHNNDTQVQYLDSLCVGSTFPTVSTASNNPFIVDGKLPDFVPVPDAIWQFPGDGKSYPLQPGEDAVLAIRGAINHAALYPLSVNLDKEDYFVEYNATYFTNAQNNPAPGPHIREDHVLRLVIKLNKNANLTNYIANYPSIVLYRAKGKTIEDFLKEEGSTKYVNNSTDALACPLDWVVDAVEIFSGSASANYKRLQDVLDAGAGYLSNTYLGHSMMRRVDEDASADNGYEVLQDTNNSTADFYETQIQSLHE